MSIGFEDEAFSGGGGSGTLKDKKKKEKGHTEVNRWEPFKMGDV